jgi:hypothetical protein
VDAGATEGAPALLAKETKTIVVSIIVFVIFVVFVIVVVFIIVVIVVVIVAVVVASVVARGWLCLLASRFAETDW